MVIVTFPIAAVLYFAPPKRPRDGAQSEQANGPVCIVRIGKQPMGPLGKGKTFIPDYIASGAYPVHMGIYKPHTKTNGAPSFVNRSGNYLYYDGQGHWIIGARLGEVYSSSSSSIYHHIDGAPTIGPAGIYMAERYGPRHSH